ncbi:MAG: FAD-binding protein [Alphaproteobacteria bacterium]|nr:FAD-binding protein [Alphaproteobacteria bacterium]
MNVIERRGDVAGAIAALRGLVGDRVSTSLALREQHGKDESFHDPAPPDAVVYARSTAEVVAIVKECARHRVPIIPFGVGTSLEGHVCALQGGISLDVSEMKEVLRLSADDLDVTVQPGITRKTLNEHVKSSGLFFPVDPGADATIGGMTATRASGTNAVRYGTMRENVLGLSVVLADGRVIRTARRARKSAAGYDLTRLFVGSEGTLGVIVEVTLRLYGIPEAMSAAVCSFATVKGAVDTVIATIQAGVPIARMELLDEVQMAAVNAYSKLNYPAQPTLFLEFHGTTRGVAEQAEAVQALAGENGGGGFQWATRPEERSRLWQARHDAAYATKALRKNARLWATDVCVPISRLADCILETQADVERTGILAPVVGHVGDGNFHLTLVVDADDPQSLDKAQAVSDRLVKRALSMDGTCTGEHGVGSGKIQYLEEEHGPALDVMRDLKRTLDPLNIMNPGKMLRL